MRFFLLTSLLNFSISLFAQVSSTGSSSVNAVIPLSINSLNPDLDFGEIILTGSSFSEYINPFNGAEFLITGHPSKNITFAFSSINLDNNFWVTSFGGLIGNILYTPLVETESGSTISSGSAYSLKPDGTIRIFIGGSINIAANQPHGDYSGVFVFSVSY